MPDTAISAAQADPPPIHPMDPRRGESLSPMFAAFLCWLLGTDPMTRPAITGISIADNSVLAATTDSPFFDAHLGTSSAICAAGARPAAPTVRPSTVLSPGCGGPGDEIPRPPRRL